MLKLVKKLGKTRKATGDYKEYVLVECDCGNIKEMREQNYLKARSCGCYAAEVARQRMRSHGASQTRLYQIWKHMKSRCTNPRLKAYRHYGGRGIGYTKQWETFEGFLNDMGDTYVDGLTLERIDNTKGYSKENCKWATRLEQQNNTRKNRIILYKGKEYTSAQLARKLGIKYTTWNTRVSRWGVCDRLFEPINESYKRT